jgi:hypothetical protein
MKKITTIAGYTTYDSRSVANLVALIKAQNEIEYTFTNSNILVIRQIPSQGSPASVPYVEVAYGSYHKNGEEEGHQLHASEFFSLDDITLAASAFVFRVNDENPSLTTGLGSTLEHLALRAESNDPLIRAKFELMGALVVARAKGVDGMGQAHALADMVKRIETLQRISSTIGQ